MTDKQTTADERSRLHGFGYAEGTYQCRCFRCEAGFVGAKRAMTCLPCAARAAAEWESLTPAQQQERRERNAAIIDDMVSGAEERGD